MQLLIIIVERQQQPYVYIYIKNDTFPFQENLYPPLNEGEKLLLSD